MPLSNLSPEAEALKTTMSEQLLNYNIAFTSPPKGKLGGFNLAS